MNLAMMMIWKYLATKLSSLYFIGVVELGNYSY